MAAQNETEFIPTAKQRRLLEALLDPQNRMKSITALCAEIGCGRNVFYRAKKSPGFMRLYEQMTIDLMKEAMGPVTNALIKEAKRGSYQHQKLFYEMVGLHTDKRVIEGNLSVSWEDILRELNTNEDGAGE